MRAKVKAEAFSIFELSQYFRLVMDMDLLAGDDPGRAAWPPFEAGLCGAFSSGMEGACVIESG
jgi:hypothetical protein